MAGLLPVTDVDSGILRLADGSVCAILECPTLAFGIKGEAEQLALAHAWSALLNSLDHPVQVVVSTRQAAVSEPDHRKASAGRAVTKALDDSYRDLLRSLSADRAIVDRHFLLVVPAGEATARRWRPGLNTGRAGNRALITDILDERVRWIDGSMRRLGIQPSRLSTREVTWLFYRALCAESAPRLPLPDDRSVRHFGGVVAPAAFRESPTEVRLGNRLARTHAITSYPQLLRPAWIERLLGFEGDLDLSLHVRPAPSAQMMGFLSRRIAELSSTLRLGEEQGRRPDPYRRAALDDAADLQDRLARGDQRLFGTSFYATVFGETAEELDAASERLEALFGSMLLHSRRLTLQMEPALISSLPLACDRVGLQRFLTTEVLAATFPFTGSDLNVSSGLLYGISPESKSPVALDSFSLHNANEVVFATSGAGKSYMAKLRLIRGHLKGIAYQVIDPEGEYAGIVEALGGTVVPLHPGEPAGLDPFRIDRDQPGALGARITTLMTLVELLAGGISPNQRAAAEEALRFAYASRGYTDEGPNAGLVPPDLSGVHTALTRRPERWQKRTRGEVEELALRLDRYVTGAGRWLFTAGGQLALGQDLVVYVLSELPDEDRAPAMFLLVDHLRALLATNSRRLTLVIDELWRLMRYLETARFVQGLSKDIRKRGAGLLLISQDIEDVLETPVGKAVVTNAASQVLMGQAPQAIPRLTELFNLRPSEQAWLLNAERGEGLLLAAGRRVPFRVVSSRVEDALIEGTYKPEREAA
ncbi:MAG TPA: DUF87 domain-containing protein [Candidatus Dormibacteraeota bacterium]